MDREEIEKQIAEAYEEFEISYEIIASHLNNMFVALDAADLSNNGSMGLLFALVYEEASKHISQESLEQAIELIKEKTDDRHGEPPTTLQ
jgi:hypothetical protein